MINLGTNYFCFMIYLGIFSHLGSFKHLLEAVFTKICLLFQANINIFNANVLATDYLAW